MDLAQRTKDGALSFDILLADDQARVTRKKVTKILEDVQWLEDTNVKIAFVKSNNGEPITIDEWSNNPGELMTLWGNNQTTLKAAEMSVDGLLKKHQRGEMSWASKAPFGFDKVEADRPAGAKDNGKPYTVLQPNEDFPVVAEIYKGFLSGSSIRGLVPELEKAPRYASTPANSTTVKYILRSPIYCGLWAYGCRNVGKIKVINDKTPRFNFNTNVLKDAISVIDYEVEKAVPKEEFLAVQKILDSNKSKSRGAPALRNYRYTSLCKCASCGGAIVAHNRPEGAGGAMHITYKCAASSEAGKKCRNHPKPYAKSFTEEEMDEFIEGFFAEHVSHSVSFHWSLIEKVAQDIVSNSTSSKSSYREEMATLEIDELDVQKLWHSLRGGTPDWLLEKQDKITDRKAELKKLLSQGATLSTIVQQKRDDWVAGSGSEGGRYLSIIWEIAEEYAFADLDWPDEKKTSVAGDIAERYLSSLQGGDKFRLHLSDWEEVQDAPSGFLSQYGYRFRNRQNNRERRIVGFSFGDPKGVLDVLASMGLDSINVRWTLGSKRGKDKWCVDSLELSFIWSDFVTGLHKTLTGTYQIGDQITSVSFQ